MGEEKLRLGGMALANGVLVHGPKSWACAIRTEDGKLQVAAQRKRQWANKVESPLLRGPARLLDAMAIIPQIRRALPEARLPFQRPLVVAAINALDHPYRAGLGQIKPVAMQRSLRVLDAERAIVNDRAPLPCDARGVRIS